MQRNRSTPTRSERSSQKHPTHSRAREVYQHIQLDFARRARRARPPSGRDPHLSRGADARPENEAALKGMADSVDHLAVSREKLLALEKGMSQRDVAHSSASPFPAGRSATTAPTRRSSRGTTAARRRHRRRLFPRRSAVRRRREFAGEDRAADRSRLNAEIGVRSRGRVSESP